MKLKKTTWIWLAIALGLASFVYWMEVLQPQKSQLLLTQQRRLFQFSSEEIKTLTIETPNKILVLERQQQNPPQWLMKQPEKTPAANASIMFLVNLLVSGQSNRTFSIASSQKSDYGLDKPQAKLTIQLNNQELHHLILGQTHFDENQIYAQIDPNPQDQDRVTVAILPITFYYAITRDLAEWKQTN